MAKFYVWDQDAVARYVLSKALRVLEAGARGKAVKDIVLSLPPNVIKFTPPSLIKGKVGPYYAELKLRWYGLSCERGLWMVKYEVVKFLERNAFTEAFLS